MLIIAFSLFSCHDFVNSKSKQIVGNIFLIDPNLPDQHGNFLVFVYPSGLEEDLLFDLDCVNEIWGNDSVLFVKAYKNGVTDDPLQINYYRIVHINGDSIVSVDRIGSTISAPKTDGVTWKYRFIDHIDTNQ